ncbi:hypothetical protein [Methylomonas sp. MK1]|uniref:hypothetical protein n=1 Tax=Methylomonas sp. MK1 TaxID=1131552 RepID=UPI00037536CC|nr:hypothetical protein [Methylomonas sp. MK1]
MRPDQAINLNPIADFLHAPVAIDVAGASPSNRPLLTRGLGCRVLDEGRQLCVFVSQPRSKALLDTLQIGSRIAAVFCLPSTEQAIQIKGLINDIRPLTAAEQETLSACQHGFAAAIACLGYSAEFSANYRYAADCVSLIITPHDIYEQTPGPLAGSRLIRPVS